MIAAAPEMAKHIGEQLSRLVCPLSTPELTQRVLVAVEHIADLELYSYQRVSAMRIIDSLLGNDGDYITCLFSRQSGKSHMMAALGVGLTIIMPVLARAFPDDERLARLAKIRIGIFGPNQDSTGPIYERMRKLAESEHVQNVVRDPDINMHLVQSRGDSLEWNLGSYVKAKTASDNAFVEGGTFHLIIIDEAQKVSPTKVRKEIAPMLAATNGTMVKIGTAWMSRGGFHSDIQSNILREKNGYKQSHFEFNYEVVVRERRITYERQAKAYQRYQQQLAELKAGKRKAIDEVPGIRTRPADPTHLQYERWIESEIRRCGGTTSEEFKMNFLLLWQESRQIALSDDEISNASVKTMEIMTTARRGVIVGGLDVAKTNDSTVLTLGEIDFAIPVHESDLSKSQAAPAATHYAKNILGWLELQGSFEKIQYGAIVEYCAKFAVQKITMDATSIGDPVCERLQILLAPLEIEVEPYTFTTSSKSDLFKYYLQEFKAGRLRFPAGPQTQETREFQRFIEQHADLTREYNGNYLVCRASEDDLHDDYPVSSALMVWASRSVMAARELPTMEISNHGAIGATRYQGAVGRHDRYRLRR